MHFSDSEKMKKLSLLIPLLFNMGRKACFIIIAQMFMIRWGGKTRYGQTAVKHGYVTTDRGGDRMSMKCVSCGMENRDGACYCRFCGAEIAKTLLQPLPETEHPVSIADSVPVKKETVKEETVK